MSDTLSTNLFNNMVFWLGDFVKFSLISPFHDGKDNLGTDASTRWTFYLHVACSSSFVDSHCSVVFRRGIDFRIP